MENVITEVTGQHIVRCVDKYIGLWAIRVKNCRYTIAYQLPGFKEVWHTGCQTIAQFDELCKKFAPGTYMVLFIYHEKKDTYDVKRTYKC